MNTKASTTRARLILAANQVVLDAGINQLTLEAVAAAAGVSKGGLLYHFPNKESLIEGMIAAYLDQFEARVERFLSSEPSQDDAAWLRAYIRATFETDAREDAISAALLAAVAINPDLLQPMRERYAVWQARLENGSLDATVATIIRLALDGLWVSGLFGMAPPGEGRRKRILGKLLEMLKEVK